MFGISTTETETPDSGPSSTVHRSVEGINENQLNNLVAQSDGGTLFHRYEWLAAVEDSLDREPRHVLVEKKGNPIGFLPNFAVDLPVPSDIGGRLVGTLPLEVVEPPPPGYGGPIVAGDGREHLAHLFDDRHLTDGPKTFSHTVQMFDMSAVGYGRYLESLGYTPRITECSFFIDLREDWETIRGNMASSRRRSMRNAVEQDHEVEILPLGEDLERTYGSYVANMERVGSTVFPREFFEALAERLSDRIRVFRATVDGEAVGRYVHLLDEESSVLHHWLSAIGDSDDFERYPSELLHRRAIRWGRQQGYDRYSFGPSNPQFSDSVFRFKQQYGGTPLPGLRWERGTLPVAWHTYDLARSWYRRSRVDAA